MFSVRFGFGFNTLPNAETPGFRVGVLQDGPGFRVGQPEEPPTFRAPVFGFGSYANSPGPERPGSITWALALGATVRP